MWLCYLVVILTQKFWNFSGSQTNSFKQLDNSLLWIKQDCCSTKKDYWFLKSIKLITPFSTFTNQSLCQFLGHGAGYPTLSPLGAHSSFSLLKTLPSFPSRRVKAKALHALAGLSDWAVNFMRAGIFVHLACLELYPALTKHLTILSNKWQE